MKDLLKHVEVLKNLKSKYIEWAGEDVDKNSINAINYFISLAESIENVKGLPEKKQMPDFNAIKNPTDYQRGLQQGLFDGIMDYNRLIDDCKLALAKMLDESKIDGYLTVMYDGCGMGRAGREELTEDERKQNKLLLSYEEVRSMVTYVIGGLKQDK